jgi:dienelactone hydrolase
MEKIRSASLTQIKFWVKPILWIGFMLCFMESVEAQVTADPNFPFKNMPEVLPGTKQLGWQGDLSVRMLEGAHKFIDGKIDQSISGRLKLWNRDLSSPAAYEKSIEPNRKRFLQYIGVEDKNIPPANYSIGFADKHPEVVMQKISNHNDPELLAETAKYKIYQVRWPVLNRVHGEGILLQPKTKPVANVIALPDADQTPEQLVGLAPGIPLESQFARHLAENGFQVLIPVLISRTLLFPNAYQQQTYREWIYRQAFHMGRHIIGFEVQKVMSAIDWFKQSAAKDLKIGVAGYSEGGLIAFYTAAADKRIDATLVSGYFNSRQQVWDEPIYRNVWGLLSEFGDAEIASLIAPRSLVIEHSTIPEMTEKIEKSEEKKFQVGGIPYTGYKGRLQTPEFSSVKQEYDRIDQLTKPGFQPRSLISGSNNIPVSFGSASAVEKFSQALGQKSTWTISNDVPSDQRSSFDTEARQIRLVKELEDHVQWLLRDSDQERNRFFLYKVMPEFAQRTWSPKAYHPYYSLVHFIEEGKVYRKYFHEEILGKFEDKMLPPNPQTRKIYDKERWTGYEVVLDVFPNLFATGILLIPKDLKPVEKRPVVVAQHGRNSTPHELVEGNFSYYNDAAAKLADQGFIVYAPQNPYRGEDSYRFLDRKANTLKKTLFSFIVSQHDQTLKWLGSLPYVDKNRIAFYGLSYGGETAMRVPSVLEGYCLSICSGDFGDWTRKVVDSHNKVSFMNTLEWEMPYFNMGNTFSYAEMAYLIFPRPFMVERGHDDLVQPDEWVSYEYGKVRYLYDKFNREDKTTIEFFNGGHSMRNEGTFRFLHKHLQWP